MSQLSTRERQTFANRLGLIRSIEPSSVLVDAQRASHDLREVKQGGVIKFNGHTYVVTGINTITECNKGFDKEKDSVTTELILKDLASGETRYIEWYVDDELEIYFTEEKLNGRRLSFAYDDDEEFDMPSEIENVVKKEWEVKVGGVLYDYDDDSYGIFRSSDGREGKVRLYEFGDDSVGWLTIEKWIEGDGDVDYEVFYASTVHPSSIEVISLGTTAAAA